METVRLVIFLLSRARSLTYESELFPSTVIITFNANSLNSSKTQYYFLQIIVPAPHKVEYSTSSKTSSITKGKHLKYSPQVELH